MFSHLHGEKQEHIQEHNTDPIRALRDELRLLEAETFEIEDCIDLSQSMFSPTNSCYSCSVPPK